MTHLIPALPLAAAATVMLALHLILQSIGA